MKTPWLFAFRLFIRNIIQGFPEFFRFTEADASILLSAYGLHAFEIDHLEKDRPNDRKATSGSSAKLSQRQQKGPPHWPISIGVHPDFVLGDWKTAWRNHVHSVNNHRCVSSDSFWEKLRKRVGEVWRDLHDDPHWKYGELCPLALLEESEGNKYRTDADELARANWFWSRRPRLLPLASWVVWFVVALGLPFWLFIVPLIGVLLLIIAALLVTTDIVRFARWRRQYELTIDRLKRTSTDGRDSFSEDRFA
jgi:hypothetical protein